jgi:hypothetical protein
MEDELEFVRHPSSEDEEEEDDMLDLASWR